MAAEDRYRVDYAVDTQKNLLEVLQYVATLPGHVRIINVIWQPAGPDHDQIQHGPHYTIISEMEI